MKKIIKKVLGMLLIACAFHLPVLADDYASSPATYVGGFYTNGELVVSVTNGSVLGLTAENIVLVPYGLANTYTNTITIRTPYQTLGNRFIRVSSGATNAVKIAANAPALALGTDWIGTANSLLELYVPSAGIASRVYSGAPTPTIIFQTAAITGVVTVTKQTGFFFDSTGAPLTNAAGAIMAFVTNASAIVTLYNADAVVTNGSASLP